MDDPVEVGGRPEQRLSRKHILTPRRIAAIAALVFLAIRFRRHLAFARDAFRYRRRMKLAFTVLALLRELRKS